MNDRQMFQVPTTQAAFLIYRQSRPQGDDHLNDECPS